MTAAMPIPSLVPASIPCIEIPMSALHRARTLAIDNTEGFRRAVLEQFEQGKPLVAVDCRNASYLDASGIRALVAIARRVADHAQMLMLVAPGADLRWLLAVTSIDRLIPVVTLEQWRQAGGE